VRRVVIQKVDLDTCLTALLLEVSEQDEVSVVADRAPQERLNDPNTLCIECGDSGQVERNDYDHHDVSDPLPPACVQPWERLTCREGPLLILPEWEAYLQARAQAIAQLAAALHIARRFSTASGRAAGYLETDVPGALGALYSLGCEVAVACSTRPFRKYTVASQAVQLDRLREALVALEPGWGGPAHGTILGSPRGRASSLDPETVLDLVRRLV